MWIPIGLNYKATVKGRLTKPVTCGRCRHEYGYAVERTATGRASSLLFLNNAGAERDARKLADRELAGELERAVEVVPCPKCGHIQRTMLPLARRLKFHRGTSLAGAAAIIGLVFTLTAVVILLLLLRQGGTDKVIMVLLYGPPALIAFVWGTVRWGQLKQKAARYDPNSESQKERIALGRALALPHPAPGGATGDRRERSTPHAPPAAEPDSGPTWCVTATDSADGRVVRKEVRAISEEEAIGVATLDGLDVQSVERLADRAEHTAAPPPTRG